MRGRVPVGVHGGPIQWAQPLAGVPLEHGITVDQVHAIPGGERREAVIGPRRPRLALSGLGPGFPGIDRPAVGIENQDHPRWRQSERHRQFAREFLEQRFVFL